MIETFLHALHLTHNHFCKRNIYLLWYGLFPNILKKVIGETFNVMMSYTNMCVLKQINSLVFIVSRAKISKTLNKLSLYQCVILTNMFSYALTRRNIDIQIPTCFLFVWDFHDRRFSKILLHCTTIWML